jgi:hypothetical protein
MSEPAQIFPQNNRAAFSSRNGGTVDIQRTRKL